MQFRRKHSLGVHRGTLRVLIYNYGVASERAENVAEALEMSVLTRVARSLMPDINMAVRAQLIKIPPSAPTKSSNASFTHTIVVDDFSSVDLDISLRVTCSSISEELQLLVDKFAKSLSLDTIVESIDRRTARVIASTAKMSTSPRRVHEPAH